MSRYLDHPSSHPSLPCTLGWRKNWREGLMIMITIISHHLGASFSPSVSFPVLLSLTQCIPFSMFLWVHLSSRGIALHLLLWMCLALTNDILKRLFHLVSLSFRTSSSRVDYFGWSFLSFSLSIHLDTFFRRHHQADLMMMTSFLVFPVNRTFIYVSTTQPNCGKVAEREGFTL